MDSYKTALTILLVLIFLYMALMFFLVNSTTRTLKRMNVSRSINRAVTIAMTIALTFGMMGGMVALIFKMGGSWLEDRSPAETYEAHGMTWEVYHDAIPLRIEDLAETDYDRWLCAVEDGRLTKLFRGRNHRLDTRKIRRVERADRAFFRLRDFQNIF